MKFFASAEPIGTDKPRKLMIPGGKELCGVKEYEAEQALKLRPPRGRDPSTARARDSVRPTPTLAPRRFANGPYGKHGPDAEGFSGA